MTSSTEVQRGATTQWWLLGLAVCAGALALFTPWAILVQLALLGVVIYRLTRRPPRSEKIVLIIALALLAGVILAYAAIMVGVYLLYSTTSGTSIPLN